MERIHNTKQQFELFTIFDFQHFPKNYRNYKNMNYGTYT